MGIMDIIKDAAPMLGPIGGVATTAIDAISQSHANASNQAFNAGQSGTQYQRGVADMKAAGLNPALAYGGQSDQAATSQVQPTFSNSTSKFATALDTYNQLATGDAQRGLIKAQEDAANAQALKTKVDTVVEQPDAFVGNSTDYKNKYLSSKMAGLAASQQQSENYPQQFKMDMAKLKADITNTAANTGSANALSNYYGTQSRLNSQQFTNEYFNKNISPFINSTAQTIKPITDLGKTFLPRY